MITPEYVFSMNRLLAGPTSDNIASQYAFADLFELLYKTISQTTGIPRFAAAIAIFSDIIFEMLPPPPLPLVITPRLNIFMLSFHHYLILRTLQDLIMLRRHFEMLLLNSASRRRYFAFLSPGRLPPSITPPVSDVITIEMKSPPQVSRFSIWYHYRLFTPSTHISSAAIYSRFIFLRKVFRYFHHAWMPPLRLSGFIFCRSYYYWRRHRLPSRRETVTGTIRSRRNEYITAATTLRRREMLIFSLTVFSRAMRRWYSRINIGYGWKPSVFFFAIIFSAALSSSFH